MSGVLKDVFDAFPVQRSYRLQRGRTEAEDKTTTKGRPKQQRS